MSELCGVLRLDAEAPADACRELIAEAIPAEPRASAEFVADSISIALAGADVNDLEKTRWARVPCEAYLTAVRFCVAHSKAYEHIAIDEEAARECFRNMVPEEVRSQATGVKVAAGVALRSSGPCRPGRRVRDVDRVRAFRGWHPAD
jgi:hypothetical protein